MNPETSSIRVIFAGGGTGGHVFPAVAMYEGLRERLGNDAVSALFVGARGGLDGRLLAGAGVPLKLLPGRGVRGASLTNKLLVPFDLARGIAAGIRAIRSFRPDVVVGTGGYASVSMVIAAIIAGTPRVLQEQNSVPGLVNRRLARFADLVLLAFTESRSAVPGGADAAVIGNPLRRLPLPDREEGARFFGLEPARPTVLVFGGSRGAHKLNVAAVDAARALATGDGVQFVLLTGQGDHDFVKDAMDGVEGGVAVRAYLEEMHHAYSAADIAVARAGASSVFELASFAVPSILVPYPHAADDHQRLNAQALEKVGAAVVVSDADLTGQRLTREIESLLKDAQRRTRMKAAMTEWFTKDAALAAADCIIDLAVKKNVVTRVERGIRPGLRDLETVANGLSRTHA
jgi:UDP-N-acetylglucosamine--N-acetylmuramyl-(pentapeptide) pyrophosphoryl-undecaprenol N-acetylglucosamine transferase